MRQKILGLVAVLLPLAALAFYLYPAPEASFSEIYAPVDPQLVASLQSFRQEHPPQTREFGGVAWEYITVGEGEDTILFLHGLTGAYDLWWQQIEALKDSYRIISVTYPPVRSLEELDAGLQSLLEAEGVDKVNIVGTSLGGYLAQYMVLQHPNLIQRAVFANTLPPNDWIAAQYRPVGVLLPYVPEWLVMAVLRLSFRITIYPSAGNDELTLAYLREMSYGRMSKSQVEARYHCVIEPFAPPDIETLGLPVLILEASNDPMVDQTLREKLKNTYPTAKVVNMGAVGHFPYLSRPGEYTGWLREFLQAEG